MCSPAVAHLFANKDPTLVLHDLCICNRLSLLHGLFNKDSESPFVYTAAGLNPCRS